MKRTRLIAVLAGIVAVAVFAADASAMHHPTLGRFTSRDPGPGGATRIGTGGHALPGGFIPRDPSGSNQYADGMNLYQYVRSRPTASRDPSGLACGSWWNDWLVPDKPGGYDFANACVNHDKCYGTCGKSKVDCDNAFWGDMVKVCSKYTGETHEEIIGGMEYSEVIEVDTEIDCREYAGIYHWAVKTYGSSAYKSAQERCGKCNPPNSNRIVDWGTDWPLPG